MINPRRLVPRFRLTIRSTMLLVAIVALIVSYAMGIDPSRHDPYTIQLNGTSEWCSLSVDSFHAEVHCDWSRPEPVWVVDQHAAPSVACLLKLAYVQRPKHTGLNAGCNVSYLALAVDGRCRRTADIYNWATQGGQSTIPPGDMASFRKLVAKLPSSQRWIPKGNALLVGFSRNGVWVSRIYDTDRLPPEILDVIAKTWPTIPWVPIHQRTSPASGKGTPGSRSGL